MAKMTTWPTCEYLMMISDGVRVYRETKNGMTISLHTTTFSGPTHCEKSNFVLELVIIIEKIQQIFWLHHHYLPIPLMEQYISY